MPVGSNEHYRDIDSENDSALLRKNGMKSKK